MQTYTRVNDNYSQAQQAVRDLIAVGIPENDISLVANKYVSEEYADVDDVSATVTGANTSSALNHEETVMLAPGVAKPLYSGLSPTQSPGRGSVIRGAE